MWLLKKYYLYKMKRLAIVITVVCVFCSCSIFHRDRYGCPKSSAAIGAEKLASGDPKATKLARKHKFHVEDGMRWQGN
jgi:hypothetical protein